MKIELLLQSLKTTNDKLRKGYLKIYFDDSFKIQSAQAISRHGSCIMMEKNTIQTEQNNIPNTISFSFISENTVIARTSLFRNEALTSKQVVLKPTEGTDKNTYTLYYFLKMTQIKVNKDGGQQQVQVNGLKKRKTLDEGAKSLSDVRQSIRYLQLGKITYLFSKRLGPVVNINNKVQRVLFWKAPQLTVSLGIILSLFIIFPKISILTTSICLLFARNYIINYIQKLISKQADDEGLLVPQQNLKFLKDFMELYCDIYQKVTDFIRDDDRTKIIAIVELMCKCGIVLFILDLIFQLQTLLVIGVWAALFSTSQTGIMYIKKILPKLLHYNRQVNKIIKNVAKSNIVKVLNSASNIEVTKQFYIYQHQRWWVGTQWSKSKWSDQKGQQQLQIRIDVPQGWKWITDWKIQFNQRCDSEGFQYANGIIDMYNPQFGKKKNINTTIRRRKWSRLCSAMNSRIVELIRKSKQNTKSAAKIANQPQIMSPNSSPIKSSKLKFQ